ncbi:hypothetical protein DFQ27_006621 [Actinomortierella ambigua]|uniref:Alpha/beta hydrolase fold-3 domain-containing protein n=1 Tax=Actinomortierella ambigua TaxID=1343610 RepID=A0A9P6PXV4_9FUNG|nr:hypothetical protein DFQ27_006621 [Actinomortierella ambigua]
MAPLLPAPHKQLGTHAPKSELDVDADGVNTQPFTILQTSYPEFPKPSFAQRIQLQGIPYRLIDMAFVIRALVSIAWSLIRLHAIELPYLIITRFKSPTRQHHPSWFWAFTIIMAISRSVARQARDISNIRLLGQLLTAPLVLSMYLRRHVKVTKSSFKVRRSVLLRPERATLSQVRERLAERLPNGKLDPLNPPDVYFDTFHPRSTGTNAQVANIPEEVGHIDEDGTYMVRGEWIEVLDDPKNPRPCSQVVCLLLQKFGPGARAFVPDYRQAPEHPFPAAIHDAFAAYMYMTNPSHEALILNDDSYPEMLAVDPQDIFVAGDSAGGNLTVAFNLYMKTYVQPSVDPKLEIPSVSVAISPWSDMGGTLPSMNAEDWHCFCPGPVGSSPFDKHEFMNFKTVHHTASNDRFVDDTRLLAHRVGLANPNRIVRLELYKDTVHVHHILEHLSMTTYATNNIVRFVLRVQQARREREQLLIDSATKGQHGGTLSRLSAKQQQQHQHQQSSPLNGSKANEADPEDQPLPPVRILSSSAKTKDSSDDNVEWIVVGKGGLEIAKNEGWPVTVLKNCWPSES